MIHWVYDAELARRLDPDAAILKSLAAAPDRPVAYLQFRTKKLSFDESLAWIRPLSKLVRDLNPGIVQIANDQAALAAELRLDGVHLGQDDGPVAAARALLGERAWIGRTIRSDAEFQAAYPDLGRAGPGRLDYFGIGTIYGTTTKTGLAPKGPDFLRPYTALCAERIYPIGGIDASKGAELRAAGARHAAVASSLFTAQDPLEEARSLLRALHD
ncbi:MAG: thiamine phosphate synthase [Verrucomicrobiota bacterium]|jgi:thiamine-phosphate pyrophosphorylase